MEFNSDNGKIEYLQMIQEPICRMSTISAIFKGFAATIVAGLSTITYSDINLWILFLSFLPIFAFALMDVYYMKMERKYRYLYEQVRTGKHPVNFSIELVADPTQIRSAKARTVDCLRSPSIYMFYPLMITVLIAVLILSNCEVI